MRDGVPVVTDGHRRLAATMYALDVLEAEIRSIPVQTEPKQASEADRVLSQIVRNSGKPLAPIEKASVFAKLMDLGWDETEIGKKVGVSRQYVTDLLTLRSAPREVVALVETGQVSATLARQTLRSAGRDAAQVLETAVTKAKESGKARATAKHVGRAERQTTNLVAFDGLIAIAAFRYALGRQSYIVGHVAHWLIANVARLSKSDRDIIAREIREAGERDGLGMDYDKAEWVKLRGAMELSL